MNTLQMDLSSIGANTLPVQEALLKKLPPITTNEKALWPLAHVGTQLPPQDEKDPHAGVRFRSVLAIERMDGSSVLTIEKADEIIGDKGGLSTAQ